MTDYNAESIQYNIVNIEYADMEYCLRPFEDKTGRNCESKRLLPGQFSIDERNKKPDWYK